MMVNQQHASTVNPLQRSIPAIFVEDEVQTISREESVRADQESEPFGSRFPLTTPRLACATRSRGSH